MRPSSFVPSLISRFNLLICFAVITAAGISDSACGQTIQFKYKPTPLDNPLRGLVPYAGQGDAYPHSLEFWYFSLKELMTGPDQFDWSNVEKKLDEIASRKCQAVLRVYMEYPSQGSATPEFLVKQGVKVTKYKHGKDTTYAPDYNDPRTRKAMQNFIVAFGKKYNGDPRIGFITMGMLGQWGEWHTYPRNDLFASKETQAEVMDAFEKAFTKTKVLMRYPSGPKTWGKAPNNNRPFGYHDDSFAWATLDTGRKEDSWFYTAALKDAGAQDKWKTQPIGGEIRPELWGCIFDKPSCAPKGQEFGKCVAATHATWLMDSGMFNQKTYPATESRKKEARKQIGKMGYELFIKDATISKSDDKYHLELTVENRGVAPFYYDWPVVLLAETIDDFGDMHIAGKKPGWQLTKAMPGETKWRYTFEDVDLSKAQLSISVKNPLEKGKPFQFANEGRTELGVVSLK